MDIAVGLDNFVHQDIVAVVAEFTGSHFQLLYISQIVHLHFLKTGFSPWERVSPNAEKAGILAGL